MALYHYTSEAGFSGIVLSKKMRVIQSTQSNDEKDTVHIYDLINENKEFFYREIDEKKVIIDLLLDFFCKFKDDQTENTNVEKSYKTFVICFTDKRDNRMLWETYAGNEGYCLGFDSRKLQEFFGNASTKEQLSQKHYTLHKGQCISKYDES